MRNWVIAFSAVPILFAAGPAAGSDYRPHTGNCRASLEEWLAREAGHGQKILEAHGGVGAFQEYTIRWDSGTVQQVTVGPTVGPDGDPAVCILARRHIGNDVAAISQ